jgi:hypothetical protein
MLETIKCLDYDAHVKFWLYLNTRYWRHGGVEAEESRLFEAVTRERLVKIQQTERC